MKDIHAKMLRKHLELLETPSDGENNKTELTQVLDEQDSDQDAEGMDHLKYFAFTF